ncbi:4-hydroxy-tetrahydrodipicolinate synthase [Desulfosporosinus nitroreducens]|uniref:4-hydroxy-tetrahydrodipicolinate synthase n=1 Tax=Desulfosporosinus nitroreducens TaxID=2018668 RepID=A0ABT8QTU3_9FIRM|nr:4-hydroxy-tetrahydrodipicolinate synthase [Desulfosporosinus nitroreducens]MCO1601717.1 4-hydroxy-tetrahydrodipicolinate synthase [Desulfosporosinus nitroreducens]MDO0824786.1 4-hydroxy-tetrahydrodipicolinate synthase [Desulfosporosinus nitroreducens]
MSFGRILTAMVTPMNEALEVDYQEAVRLAKYLTDHGSDGVVVCGTTGESPTVTDQEKIELFKAIKGALGTKATVIAGIGSNSTNSSVSLARMAATTGVDGLMAVVPYYNKPSQEGMFQHFKAIAEASSLPLMLYNVPGRTSANLMPETVKRLSEIPNIVSLKEAAGSLDQVTELKRLLPAEFEVYSGDDSMTLPMLALGCSGIISVAAHVIGDEMKAMVDAWFAGDTAQATKWHLELFPVFKGIFVTSNPVPIKALMNMIGIKAGGVRLPLVEATSEEITFLQDLLKTIKKSTPKNRIQAQLISELKVASEKPGHPIV